MARTLEEIRLFAASPSDVQREREEGVRRVVDEINLEIAARQNLVIRPATVGDVSPDLGRAQEVVLDQIGDFDIFVGIMGSHFGSPTGRYASGTQEEFYTAYNSWKMTRTRPRVMFYFRQSLDRMPGSEEEVAQLGEVVKFRREIDQLGMTRKYHDYDEFVELFRRDLTAVVLRWRAPAPEEEREFEEAREKTTALPWWPVWRDAFLPQRSKGERTEAFLYRAATRSIKFMTISGRSIFTGDVEDTLREKSRAGLSIRLLLFDWNSSWFPAKMRDERRETELDIDMARRKARTNAQQFLMLTGMPNLDLQIRLYREYPVWRLLVVDEAAAYLGYYPAGMRGYEGPMFIFKKDHELGLFNPVNQYFDMLWQRCGDNLRRDDPRLELLPLSELETPKS